MVRVFVSHASEDLALAREVYWWLADACHEVFLSQDLRDGITVGADERRGCVIENRVRIGYDALVGRGVRLVYGAYLCDRVGIGDGARVAEFVCDGARIEPRWTAMWRLVHECSRPHRGWWTDLNDKLEATFIL